MGFCRVDPSHSTDLDNCGSCYVVRQVHRAAKRASGIHCRYQRTIAQQVQHPIEVVGEYMQAHFRAYPVERPREEMGGAHPGLQCAERTLHAHHLRSLIQARLHGVEHRLVFPASPPPLCARCALIFQRTALEIRTPAALHFQAFLNCRKRQIRRSPHGRRVFPCS